MLTKAKIICLSLIIAANILSAPPTKDETASNENYMSPLKKAYTDYNSKFEKCIENEKTKPSLKTSDISFLNRNHAQVMFIIERKHRLSTCTYPEENIVIRKHIETLSLLRSKGTLPAEEEMLAETIDTYFGLEDKSHLELRKKYAFIPERLRKRFDYVVKDKSLEVNFVELTDALPE